MCSRICKHNYRITIIVKIGYRDHSPAGLVVTGVPLAQDDMHSPRAPGRPLSIHPGDCVDMIYLDYKKAFDKVARHRDGKGCKM